MNSENQILLHAALLGIYLAFLYDTIRIFRRCIGHNVLFISLEDIVYWFYLAAKVFLMMYRESNGRLRWFAVLGAGAGILIYTKLFGKYYVCYISRFLNKIGKRIQKIYKNRLKTKNKLLKIRLCKR